MWLVQSECRDRGGCHYRGARGSAADERGARYLASRVPAAPCPCCGLPSRVRVRQEGHPYAGHCWGLRARKGHRDILDRVAATGREVTRADYDAAFAARTEHNRRTALARAVKRTAERAALGLPAAPCHARRMAREGVPLPPLAVPPARVCTSSSDA